MKVIIIQRRNTKLAESYDIMKQTKTEQLTTNVRATADVRNMI